MNRDDLVQIATRASTLFERLSDDYVPIHEPAAEKAIADRLQRWRERVAKGDEDRWQQRLQLESLGPDQVRSVLGQVQMADESKLPSWTETLEEVIEVAATIPTDELRKRLPPRSSAAVGDDPPESSALVRFEAFVLPFFEVACRKLRQMAGKRTISQLSEDARGSLEHEMLRRLSSLCWQTLQWEFAIFRSTRRSSIFYRFTKPGATPSTDLYEAFTSRLLGDGLLGFFKLYPVLARLMATRTQLWAEATAEFLERLCEDAPRLQEVFQQTNAAAAVGQVRSFKPGLSDPHNRYRMAVAIDFESGLKLVYKPRNLGLEKAWFGLLDWVNGQGTLPKLKVIEVLNLGTHGWVEFVPHEPVEDQAAADRYYERVGMQLALLHVFEGTDFHYENIIACGEQPVLIDLEMILHHRLNERDSDKVTGADQQAHELLGNSVLRSGLLPQWAMDRPGEAVDMSGLGSTDDNQMPEVPRLEHINSDSMDVVFKRADSQQGANELIMDDTPQSACAHASKIVNGFERTYQFLIEKREKIIEPGGPLPTFQGQSVRFVYRPTRLYGQLLQFSLQSRYLRDGADRSIELDMLSHQFLLNDEEEKMFPVLRHERAALERLDVPIFHAGSHEDCLRLANGEVIEACFRETSDALVLSRLHDLNDHDREIQVRVIRSSLYSRAARHKDQIGSTAPRERHLDDVEPLSSEEAIAEAMAIGEELRNRAIAADDGSATWLGLELISKADRWQLQPLGRELYGGTCGVALFLATLENITADRRFRDTAMGALASLQSMLRDSEIAHRIDDDFAIGGAAGLGSYVYSLARVSQLLDEKELLQDATRAALLISDTLIENDESLDIVGGAAGAILGLLALRDAARDNGENGDVAGETIALDRAVACGRHLLENRTVSTNGPRAWRTLSDNDRLLTGFSHGAAGNAYALLRLFEATGDEKYRQAAGEAIEYERAVFSAEQGNWPDFREMEDDSRPQFMVTWCHGAAGIGLARAAGLSAIDSPEVRQEIDTAITAILKTPLNGRDHLCCGALGNSDILLTLSRKLERPELEDCAKQRVAFAVHRARQQGYRLLDIEAEDAFVPGMFQGLSGIGYGLLRLAEPDKVPSVLLWE